MAIYKFWKRIITVVVLAGLLSNACWATAYNNVMNMVSVSISLIFGLCELTGVLFLGIALSRYRMYRQNPSETPLSRVLYVLIFGLAMLILPYIAEKTTTHKIITTAAQTQS